MCSRHSVFFGEVNQINRNVGDIAYSADGAFDTAFDIQIYLFCLFFEIDFADQVPLPGASCILPYNTAQKDTNTVTNTRKI
jgi:hypothetical protein